MQNNENITKNKNTSKESLKLIDINKSFGANKVLFDVSITINPGEVHALVGENGAGKSTMMNIIAGIHRLDSGKVQLGDTDITIHTPKQSQSNGIMLMHQELSIFPEMTIADNIFAGRLPKNKIGLVDKKRLFQAANDILTELDCGLKAEEFVKDLSVANKHICEFARFLTMQPKFIILDEPTAALTEREKEIIFHVIRRLKKEYNLGILYISHRMHEIFEVADKVSILRDGYMQGTFGINEISEEEITRLMIGYDISKVQKVERKSFAKKEPLIEVKNLYVHHLVRNVSFDVHKGEILGMAGLLGARRTEIAEAIFGIRKITSGEININSKSLKSHSVQSAIENSIALVPGDRKQQGLVLEMNCMENVTLSILKTIRKRGVISSKNEQKIYKEFKDVMQIKASSHKQKIVDLSGGNQQKILLAKWLSINPELLILDEPTRGIDVGTKADIYRLIQELAAKGCAILLITSDMNELLTLSHRILAIYDGEISAELEDDEITEDNVINAISKL